MKYFPVALMILSLSGTAFAGHHGDKGHDGAAYMKKLSNKLELNEEQVTAVKQLHEQYRADKQALRKQHRQEMSGILNAEQMEKYLKMKMRHHHKAKK